MPYSNNTFDQHIASLINLLRPKTICDIGPGAGKYGKIARHVAAQGDFPVKLVAAEMDASYVEQFKLGEIYDEIIIDDASNLINQPRRRFDLVIIGDCIEHFRKSAGIDLINFLVYRAGYIAIIYPDSYVQDDWDGHAQEAHISVWSSDDFRGLNLVKASIEDMNLFLIKGYQPTLREIASISSDSITVKNVDQP